LIPGSDAQRRSGAEPSDLGRYPTPVDRLLTRGKSELWVKRDDLSHPDYGGNKVRKLEGLLAELHARGTRRIVTVGAAGSHHVLATTYFGRRAGLDVEAVLVPQPRTEHAAEVLRASIGQGVRAFPVDRWSAAPWAVARRIATGARYLPFGGSSVTGAMGYANAARELVRQVQSGVLPEPSTCVVALGSGGTAAGLAAGLVATPLRTRVLAVCVSPPAWVLRLAARRIARGCAARLGLEGAQAELGRRLVFTGAFIGPGYGRATDVTRLAQEEGRLFGLELDPTYTAKAFAAALAELDATPMSAPVVLYWHTLSSAPLAPLLRHAPSESDLSTSLRELLV
jgi:1-aminocyclopropane-1-carboxylate deaminase/D-cysteine desulfhydrase-like pyridoxal-dependent ACC family enzyme